MMNLNRALMAALLATTLTLAGCGDSAPTLEERTARAHEMIARAQAEPSFPKTPEAAIRAFWDAASRKDYDRLLVLCPGADKSDFQTHYDQFTPQPSKAIGKPQPHPTDANFKVYPVQVPFPGFPNKVVKMAVFTDDKGNCYIDGQHTIWW